VSKIEIKLVFHKDSLRLNENEMIGIKLEKRNDSVFTFIEFSEELTLGEITKILSELFCLNNMYLSVSELDFSYNPVSYVEHTKNDVCVLDGKFNAFLYSGRLYWNKSFNEIKLYHLLQSLNRKELIIYKSLCVGGDGVIYEELYEIIISSVKIYNFLNNLFKEHPLLFSILSMISFKKVNAFIKLKKYVNKNNIDEYLLFKQLAKCDGLTLHEIRERFQFTHSDEHLRVILKQMQFNYDRKKKVWKRK